MKIDKNKSYIFKILYRTIKSKLFNSNRKTNGLKSDVKCCIFIKAGPLKSLKTIVAVKPYIITLIISELDKNSL